MKVTVKFLGMTEKGNRHYIATNRKGETVEAKVHDSGMGFSIFWKKVLSVWPKAYTA